MTFKHICLAIAINPLLCFSLTASAAYLERIQDQGTFFYYGQRGLGVNQNGATDTNFGQLGLVSDIGVSVEWSGQGGVSINSTLGTTSLTGTQQLSIFATDATQTTYLIDAFASLTGTGSYAIPNTTVNIKNDAFDQPAYADVWVRQSFHILPSPGEKVGDAVLISVGASTFLNASNIDPKLVQDAILDGLPGQGFKITHNSSDLVSLPGAIHTSQIIYSSSFVGEIGDVIGFEGPTVFARLTIPDVTFNDGDGWNANVTASFYGSVTVAPVPEPEVWAMLLAGLGLVGLRLARSRENRIG
jgi:hypothetical protein